MTFYDAGAGQQVQFKDSEVNGVWVEMAKANDDDRKVRDALLEVIRLWKGAEMLTAPMLALRLREAGELSLSTLEDLFPNQQRGPDDPPPRLKFGLLLRSFPSIFRPYVLSSQQELRALVQANALVCPADRYPVLPQLCWSLAKEVAADPHGFLMKCEGSMKLWDAVPLCMACKQATPLREYVGHSIYMCRFVESPVERHRAGLRVEAQITKRKHRLREEWEVLDRARDEKRRRIDLRLRGHNAGAVGGMPWKSGDLVVARAAKIPIDARRYLVGAGGNNLQLLREQLSVLITVPFLPKTEDASVDYEKRPPVMVRGTEENVTAAIEYLETRYGVAGIDLEAAQISLAKDRAKRVAAMLASGDVPKGTRPLRRVPGGTSNRDGGVGSQATRRALRYGQDQKHAYSPPPPTQPLAAPTRASYLPQRVVKEENVAENQLPEHALPLPPAPAVETTPIVTDAPRCAECPTSDAESVLVHVETGDKGVQLLCVVCRAEHPECPELRTGPDGSMMTEDDFLDTYGGLEEWEAAAPTLRV